ncbi:F-type H+-transporting ATPase subunit gamma [Thermodesulfovibrio aggregans]|uniref:ATP synthase gamma chain n=1 Tax=Thermodesulfovibrio aggregans TaxID=86166 RepID=A0A0U9HQM0_9BACT|nr:ATP synthase F1 subunit gamma [Thermodesulfovibrio aggregans]GAQ95324.1 F-type H+-transporting ATPase subunit gamma [Thermodesulfovibrio aggregans]
MPSLRDIRKKIKAIQGTKKITSAMKMVAAAKLRKVQDSMLRYRPYASKMQQVLADLAGAVETRGDLPPLLIRRPIKTVEVLVITSDKGLCGAFNTNILRVAAKEIDRIKKEGLNVSISVVGRKARDYFKRRDIPVKNVWTGISGKLQYTHAQMIAQELINSYVSEAVDEVLVIYNEFKSVISQRVVINRILPIGRISSESSEQPTFIPFTYEPRAPELFAMLLPIYIEIQIYRALLESQAAEEAARMTAMDNATKNCDELIKKTTLIANKVRQASITKELMDIVGGVEALKQSEG